MLRIFSPGRATGAIACIAAALAAVAAAQTAAARQRFSEWATIHHERHGFRIAYPVSVFEQRSEPTDEDGRVLISHDGRARLVVGAFRNDDDLSLGEYRRYVLQENYSGARVTYAPVRGGSFILSGYRDGQVFYQRVSFTCGGRLITSWAMLYPASEKRFYDRVVEAVAPTFLPGAGRTGECD